MSDPLIQAVKATIRNVPDFPKPGIQFKDITPVLADARLFSDCVNWVAGQYAGRNVDHIVGMESRGFIFGAAVAPQLHAGFIPARKPGKLPWHKLSASYELEYGTNTLEIHKDALGPGDKVVIVDDLLATGGTAAATVSLCRQAGAEVLGCVFLVELGFLEGRAKLDVPIQSLAIYG